MKVTLTSENRLRETDNNTCMKTLLSCTRISHDMRMAFTNLSKFSLFYYFYVLLRISLILSLGPSRFLFDFIEFSLHKNQFLIAQYTHTVHRIC